MAEITSAKAMARTVRVSPRKSRLILDNIRGKNVADAIAILKFTPNKAAGIIEKVLNSAIANAENNFGLEKANLVVSEVISAIYVLLIFYVFSCRLQRDLCKYVLVQTHQVCDLPCLLGCKQVRVYVRHKLRLCNQ